MIMIQKRKNLKFWTTRLEQNDLDILSQKNQLIIVSCVVDFIILKIIHI